MLNDQNECVIDPNNNNGPSDLKCAEWDWDNGICMKCAHRHIFNLEGMCVPVSDSCREWNGMGDCTSCYGGFELDA